MTIWIVVLGIWVVLGILLTIRDRRRAQWKIESRDRMADLAREKGIPVSPDDDRDVIYARVRHSMGWPDHRK